MTRTEAAAYVMRRWVEGENDFHVKAVMMYCITMGYPAKQEEIKEIIRHYINSQTENKQYRAKA